MNNYPRAFDRATPAAPVGWTPDRIEALKKLWDEGLSASQIANKLGYVSRNAIIGKVHRLGLSGRAKPSPPAKPARVTPPRVRVVANKQTFVEPPPRPAKVEIPVRAFVPLEVCAPVPFGSPGCKWPVAGEGADMLCCGAKRRDESPYCHHHHAIGFVPHKPLKPAQELARALRRYI